MGRYQICDWIVCRPSCKFFVNKNEENVNILYLSSQNQMWFVPQTSASQQKVEEVAFCTNGSVIDTIASQLCSIKFETENWDWCQYWMNCQLI